MATQNITNIDYYFEENDSNLESDNQVSLCLCCEENEIETRCNFCEEKICNECITYCDKCNLKGCPVCISSSNMCEICL